MQIDINYDFRTDAGGRDPDKYSSTLRRYHKLLWSKPLQCGRLFALVDAHPKAYLHHQSDLGEFFLSSDSVIPSFTKWASLNHLICHFPEDEHEAFRAIGYTMGGMMIFPANRVERKCTINGARGLNRRIADRFDLTLECIRRHYLGMLNPLGDTLSRYNAFFSLFSNFVGYVDFFLLQDLVKNDGSAVRFFMPFDDFKTPPVPRDVDEYRRYRARSIEFIHARNRRIKRSSGAAGC